MTLVSEQLKVATWLQHERLKQLENWMDRLFEVQNLDDLFFKIKGQ